MARSAATRRDERQRAVERAREAYAREFERKRAARGAAVKAGPFDPMKFVEQLRRQSKASVHTVAYSAVLTTILVLGLRPSGMDAIGAFVALLLIGTLYYYLKLVWDVDISKLGKPTAAVGVWLTYFVTWLMLSFLLSNPPIHDTAPPVVRCCTYLDNPNVATVWEEVNGTVLNDTDGHVRVRAEVFDNGALANVSVDLLDSSQVWRSGIPMTHEEGRRYVADLTGLSADSYTIVVRATDSSGLTASDLKSFQIA